MDQLHAEQTGPYVAMSDVRILLYSWAATEFGEVVAGDNDQKAGRNCVIDVSKVFLHSSSHILTVPILFYVWVNNKIVTDKTCLKHQDTCEQ